ncbi:MAG: SLOG family protein [Oscillospiraceae bacterium]
MDRTKSCCFTGHRPAKLPWGDNENDPRCVALKAQLERTLEDAYRTGYRHFICGMATGSDFYFCEAVLALRSIHGDVTLEGAIPCVSQADSWSQQDRERYRRLLAQCDFETLVQQHYDRGCMHRRNRYMVDRAGCIIAVYDGMMGGTLYTLDYAVKEGLQLVLLDTAGGSAGDNE